MSSDAEADAEVREALADAMAEQRLRIVASLIRTTRDWDLAEDAVADAAERALLTWPRDGVPGNPAAWLTISVQLVDASRTLLQPPADLWKSPPQVLHTPRRAALADACAVVYERILLAGFPLDT